MTAEDDWAWIGELPEEWVPPAEVMSPTSDPSLNLPIIMLSSQMLGNISIDLVGRLISESARFSIWFATEAKDGLTPKELISLTIASEDRIRRTYEAWHNFAVAFEASGRRAGAADDERATLDTVLRAVVGESAEARRSQSE